MEPLYSANGSVIALTINYINTGIICPESFPQEFGRVSRSPFRSHLKRVSRLSVGVRSTFPKVGVQDLFRKWHSESGVDLPRSPFRKWVSKIFEEWVSKISQDLPRSWKVVSKSQESPRVGHNFQYLWGLWKTCENDFQLYVSYYIKSLQGFCSCFCGKV
jgi:hypothetical protein